MSESSDRVETPATPEVCFTLPMLVSFEHRARGSSSGSADVLMRVCSTDAARRLSSANTQAARASESVAADAERSYGIGRQTGWKARAVVSAEEGTVRAGIRAWTLGYVCREISASRIRADEGQSGQATRARSVSASTQRLGPWKD